MLPLPGSCCCSSSCHRIWTAFCSAQALWKPTLCHHDEVSLALAVFGKDLSPSPDQNEQVPEHQAQMLKLPGTVSTGRERGTRAVPWAWPLSIIFPLSFAYESLRTAVFASLYTGEELGWKVNTAASTPLTRSTGCIKWLPFFSLHTGQWSKEDSYSQRLKSKYLNAGVPLERNIVLNKCPILRLPEIIDIC